jgi:hypothetical protein
MVLTRTVRFSRCSSRGSVAIFGLYARGTRTVRLVFADRPPQPCGMSGRCLAVLLRPLLLEFHFHFGIVWGLFLGLAGLL